MKEKKFIDKFDFVVKHTKNKEVLDIGCVEELKDFSKEKMLKTQHCKIKQYTKRLVGIDLEEKGVEALNSIGCEVYYCLAEDAYKLLLLSRN